MSGRLEGKAALVTGGASGIGRAIALRYASEGARVAIADANEVTLRSTLKDLGEGHHGTIADVTSEADVARMVAETVSAFGRLDIAVNAAGIGTVAPLVAHSEEQWNAVMDVNLKGVFLCMKHEAGRMREQGGGVIINIASINARQPATGMIAYCASKAGVAMMTRVAALELASAGIRVLGIGPGLIDTPLTRYQQERPRIRQAYLEQTPLGRIGDPADVADLALFLASDEARWMTGETVYCDGGELLQKYPDLLDAFRAEMEAQSQ